MVTALRTGRHPNPPNKHHYIPAFYLKKWAEGDKLICQWSRPAGRELKPLRVHPNGTGYEIGLYSLDGFPKAIAQQIEENFFKPIDTLADRAHQLLLSEGREVLLDANMRSAWTNFILSLLLRMPEDLHLMRQVCDEFLYKTEDGLDHQYKEIRSADQPEEFEEYLRTMPKHIREKHFFEMYMSTIANKNIGTYINNMYWNVVDVSESRWKLFTSDRPVIRSKGLGPPHGHIVMPISPSQLFVANASTAGVEAIRNSPIDRIVSETNTVVVNHACKYAYSSNDLCARFMRNHFGEQRDFRVAEGLLKPH